jgi:DNA-binding NtrC family response regulator
MQEHPWPGNLRQLRNALERGLILAGQEPAAIPEGPRRSLADLIDPQPADDALPLGPSARPPRPLVEIEQEHIRAALAFTRGHQGRAAGLLGISRKALWEKRRRYGIP